MWAKGTEHHTLAQPADKALQHIVAGANMQTCCYQI
jgi:hypothetical protein